MNQSLPYPDECHDSLLLGCLLYMVFANFLFRLIGIPDRTFPKKSLELKRP